MFRILLSMLACLGFFALDAVDRAHAFPTGTVDSTNIYRNVGMVLFTHAPNGLGIPVGPTGIFCTGTLIHERVVLTAGHCMGYGVRGDLPSWLRVVVSFSPDKPEDPATWIETTAQLVNPAFPYEECIITGPFDAPPCPGHNGAPIPYATPGLIDLGLLILAHPVTDIAPAPLATANQLVNAEGRTMIAAGYGCGTDMASVHPRRFATNTLANINNEMARYNLESVACPGDSGSPTFFDGHVVAVLSDGDGGFSLRPRVDTPDVLKWIASVIDSLEPSAEAVEFYNASLDHFFLTHVAGEIHDLDAGVHAGWARTGQRIRVYTQPKPGTSPVCRYYIPPGLGNSHFYGRGTVECQDTGVKNPAFALEDPQFLHMVLPAAGRCPYNSTTKEKVYRVFSNRADANHRYMIDPAIREQMVARGWLAEGDGPDAIVMCGPE